MCVRACIRACVRVSCFVLQLPNILKAQFYSSEAFDTRMCPQVEQAERLVHIKANLDREEGCSDAEQLEMDTML